MKLIVDPKALNRLFWNAALFTPKGGATGGRALFAIRDGRMVCFSCDDFVAVADFAEFGCDISSGGFDLDFTLAVADIKKLDVMTRSLTEPVELWICEAQLHVLDDVFEHESPKSFWMEIVDLIEQEHAQAAFPEDLYINSERIARVARLKTDGDHPLGFRFELDDSGQQIVRFIYGPTIHGVITSMDPEVLRGRDVTTFD